METWKSIGFFAGLLTALFLQLVSLPGRESRGNNQLLCSCEVDLKPDSLLFYYDTPPDSSHRYDTAKKYATITKGGIAMGP